MPEPLVTVVVPTLAADPALAECLASLRRQSWPNLEILVVDNSGKGLVRRGRAAACAHTVVEPARNLGFGAAVNEGFRRSAAPFLATLNDDAVACPGWLAALVSAMQDDPRAGMCASQVRLYGEDRLDSAGMLICADGSSKQRGHLCPPQSFATREEVLCPSGSAALYRRAMLDEIGCFDDDFFLYCEDTDLGLRARWAGWKCWYVPQAVVEHRYSQSAGRASPLKAYYVERNRLFLVVKNFPPLLLLRSPLVSMARYLWHLVWMMRGRGSAARFRREGNSALRMVLYVLQAHWQVLRYARSLWRKRRAIRGSARLSAAEFGCLLRAHSIGARQVAEL